MSITVPKKKVVFTFDPDNHHAGAHAIMGRTAKRPWRDDPPPFVSRDYAGEFKCRARACPVNRDGCCSVPTAASINEAGQCETVLKFKENPPPKPQQRCMICGGTIELVLEGFTSFSHAKWRHNNGESLSHEAVAKDDLYEY